MREEKKKEIWWKAAKATQNTAAKGAVRSSLSQHRLPCEGGRGWCGSISVVGAFGKRLRRAALRWPLRSCALFSGCPQGDGKGRPSPSWTLSVDSVLLSKRVRALRWPLRSCALFSGCPQGDGKGGPHHHGPSRLTAYYYPSVCVP